MKQLYIYLFAIHLLFFGRVVTAQSVFVPYDPDFYHTIERYEIMRGKFSEGFHSSFRPWERKAVYALADSLNKDSVARSVVDKANINWMYATNIEWGNAPEHPYGNSIAKGWNLKKADMFAYNSPELDLHASLAGNGWVGNDPKQAIGSRQYLNTRALELRGMVDKKVGFYAMLTENQMRAPDHVIDYVRRTGVLPNESFWKIYKNKPGEYDFFNARGYITFNATKHIHLQFGHDRNVIGHGYRSLVLSDFAGNYTFLKATTRVWKFQYTNLFANLKGPVGTTSSGTRGSIYQPDKYMAMHHLSFNATRWLNIGVFETIMFGGNRDGRANFDVNYLNPVIFYRAIEQYQGSPDNALLGLDAKANLLKCVQLYTQFFLDEFYLKEVRAKNGWWGNKYALQAGVKYINAFTVSNLDIQGEVNIIRPFTYQHEDAQTNYSHYNMPLAHPLGANLREAIGIIRYQPMPKLFVTVRLIQTLYGKDTLYISDAKTNIGNSVMRNYRDRVGDFNHTIAGNGIRTNLTMLEFAVSYRLMYNVFLDFRQILRREATPGSTATNSMTFLGMRLNMPQRNFDF
jgi:hypothetical protein